MPEHVISAPDVSSIYDVPINFEKDKIGELLLKKLTLTGARRTNLMSQWRRFVAKTKRAKKKVRVALIGKYFDTGDFMLSDSYISVIEALKISAYTQDRIPELTWLSAEEFEKNARTLKKLDSFDGIVVPGGFGDRGILGKIKVIEYARKKKIPYLGLCYGMQLAVVEFARNVVKLKRAHTTEVLPQTPHPVIDIMPEQKKIVAEENYGGTMRLGEYVALLKKGTIARSAYGTETAHERHRHRYEVNPAYIKRLEKAGLVFSGVSPDGKLMEIAELPKKIHPFFLGTQFHPEFQARPLAPHPLFNEFMNACIK